MNRGAVVAILAIAAFCCLTNSGAAEDRLKRIGQHLSAEQARLRYSLRYVKANLDAEWAEGDIRFYSLWLKGTFYEQKGEYGRATAFYRKALDTPRYEMESYEVRIALGRALVRSGRKAEGRRELQRYIKGARGELNGDTEWIPTEEKRAIIADNIRFAKWLMKQTSYRTGSVQQDKIRNDLEKQS